METVNARLVFDKTDEVLSTLNEGVKRAMLSTVAAIESVAAGLSRIDTGAMMSGYYHIGLGEDTYSEAIERASALYATKHAGDFPAEDSIDPPEQSETKFTVLISNVAGYFGVNELGGHGRDASPAMTTAAEGQRGSYVASVIEALGHE